MNHLEFLNLAKHSKITFTDCLTFIDKNYLYTPAAFQNGTFKNLATENQGSAKVLYFAQLNNLSKEDTLLLFTEHYDNVLSNPNEAGHPNIRQFIANGWDGIFFDNPVLVPISNKE